MGDEQAGNDETHEADARVLGDEVLGVTEADPRVVARMTSPGRVLGIGVDLWRAVLANPTRAGATLRRGLREARALHSRERRLVGDVLRDLCRVHGLLDAVGASGSADPALAHWLLWAVHLGADAEEARAAWAAEGHPALPEAAWTAARGLGQAHAPLRAWVGAPDDAGGRRAVAELERGLGDALGAHLAASAGRAPVVLRGHGMTRDELVNTLRGHGIEAAPGRWARTAVVVPTGTDLNRLPPALGRRLQVQDEGSQLLALLVDPRKGERVLDYCAGAGGKSLALADLLDGPVWATDVRGAALAEAKKRARDAGVKLRTALLRDGRPSCDLGGPFDAVLVDAPCTGSGVWRRHPELRWRLGQLPELLGVQDRVLDEAAALVRPGGRLIYGTCSVLPAEDEDRVTAFLARHPGWQLAPARQVLPEIDASLLDGPFLRPLPHRHGCDGFFGAVLERW